MRRNSHRQLQSAFTRGVGIAIIAVAMLGVGNGAAQFPDTAPQPGAPRPVELPPFEQATLANGMRLVLVENHELPIVSIAISSPGGTSMDPRGKEGVASLTADVIVRGTTARTADEIAAEIEGVGASLNAGAGADFFTISTTVLKDHVGLAFALLGDVVTNSIFPESEVELSRTRTLSAIRASEAQPEFLADQFFAQALYGDHAYGRTATSASVGAVTRSDILAFASQHLKPDGSLLVIAGDLTLSEATDLANEAFAQWNGTARDVALGDVPEPRPTEIILVNRPGSVQSEIRIGNLTMQPGDDDYYAATVIDKLLGTGFDSRLFLIVREERGWTYDIRTSHNRPRGTGRFLVRSPVRTEVTDSVLAEVFKQLERIRTEPVPTDELDGATGFLVGSFPLRIETAQQVAGQVRSTILLGLGDDYLGTYRQRIASITPDDLIDVAGRLIRPDSAVVVVVGDGTAIYDKLTRFGPVRIIDADGNPLTEADLAPDVSAVAFEQEHIVSRQDSFTILVQGNEFGHLTRDIQVDDATIIYRAAISLGPILSQTTELIVNRETMRPLKLDQSAQQQGQQLEVHVEYAADGRVTGNASVPLPDGRREEAVDTLLGTHILDDNMLQALAGALPLRVDESFFVASYDAAQGQTSIITVNVSDAGTITVPAGDFEAYKLEMTGAPTTIEYWVSKNTPRTLLRMEFPGQPVSFQLVSTEIR